MSEAGNNQEKPRPARAGGRADFTFKVITIGDKSVGKSCCITRYFKNSYAD